MCVGIPIRGGHKYELCVNTRTLEHRYTHTKVRCTGYPLHIRHVRTPIKSVHRQVLFWTRVAFVFRHIHPRTAVFMYSVFLWPTSMYVHTHAHTDECT